MALKSWMRTDQPQGDLPLPAGASRASLSLLSIFDIEVDDKPPVLTGFCVGKMPPRAQQQRPQTSSSHVHDRLVMGGPQDIFGDYKGLQQIGLYGLGVLSRLTEMAEKPFSLMCVEIRTKERAVAQLNDALQVAALNHNVVLLVVCATEEAKVEAYKSTNVQGLRPDID